MNNLNKSYNTFDYLADGIGNVASNIVVNPITGVLKDIGPVRPFIAGGEMLHSLADGEGLGHALGEAAYWLNPFLTLGTWGDTQDADEYASKLTDMVGTYFNPKTEEDLKYGHTGSEILYTLATGTTPHITAGSIQKKEDEKAKEEDKLAKIQAAQDKLEQEQNRRYERQRAALKDASVAMLNWGKSDREPFRFNLLGV